jgi:hypothetical protein
MALYWKVYLVLLIINHRLQKLLSLWEFSYEFIQEGSVNKKQKAEISKGALVTN